MDSKNFLKVVNCILCPLLYFLYCIWDAISNSFDEAANHCASSINKPIYEFSNLCSNIIYEVSESFRVLVKRNKCECNSTNYEDEHIERAADKGNSSANKLNCTNYGRNNRNYCSNYASDNLYCTRNKCDCANNRNYNADYIANLLRNALHGIAVLIQVIS